MPTRKIFNRNLIFIFGILIFSLGFASAVTSSFIYSQNTQYSQPGTYNTFSSTSAQDYWPILSNSDECEASTDFLMFIQPASCNPTVVRSDLLEEQNVPIFCKVDMIKLNPFIDVSQIKSVKFENAGGFGKYVAGVNFHPNHEAIYSREVFLDKPFINNVGYVVILLRRIPAEKDMPDSVKVNLTGVLRFDSEEFFGTGQNDYYLEEIKDEGLWKATYKDNSAFKGGVYLRTESIYDAGATVSLYKDADTKIRTFNLKVGETSETYYLPGFYCRGQIKIKLDEIVGGVKKVSLDIDDNSKWYVEGEKFLDNKCEVKKINLLSDKKSVEIYCKGMQIQKLVLGAPDENAVEESSDNLNVPIDELARKIYDNAKEQQSDIKSYYGDVESLTGEVWSAKSLYDLADLAEKIGMKSEARELFNQVASQYSGTSYARGAAERIDRIEVPTSSYDGHFIKLINIQGPTRDEVSVEFEVKNKDGEIVEIGCRDDASCKAKLDKDKEICENIPDNYECTANGFCEWKSSGCDGKVQSKETFAKVFKLLNIYQDKVEVQYSSSGGSGKTETFILNWDDREQTKGGYSIKLKKINFKDVAKVSLISDIPNQYSKSDFSFEIGIEKRAIQLSPEKAQEMIDSLNKTINDLNKTVDSLGKVVKTMKGVCLGTSAVLIAKNFFSGLGGGATARQNVMPMWYERCQREAGTDKNLFDKCLNNYNNEIEDDIKIYQEKIKSVNSKVIDVQKENKNPSGSVDRKDAAVQFKKEVSPMELEFEKYVSTDENGVEKTEPVSISISQEHIDKSSLTDLRDIKLNQEILNSDASDVAKNAAKLNLEKIYLRLNGKVMENSKKPLSVKKGDSSVKWINKVNAQYFLSGTNQGLVHIVPIPGTYGEQTGFYAVVDEGGFGATSGYSSGADIKEFWIQNIGNDELLDVADDDKTLISYATQGNDYLTGRILVSSGLEKSDSIRLVRKAVDSIKTANRNYGKSRFSLEGFEVLVDKSAAGINEKRCQDFMSPKDCWIMFNACDSVLCPSSRCDLGGRYKVDDVIQSGIVGSIFLCLPNIQEKIIIPVCLSGIHAGLDAYLSIVKSYQDCLKENVATGKTVGICDEIHSIYLCEFFWKQATPVINMGAMTVLEKVNGQGMKGGGEYLTIQDAWKQASGSVDYMKNTYAVNAYNAFRARSTGEIGTEFCKAFISASAPNKGTLDALLEPDSPVQFHAWFDEIKFTDATVPATSQYKVYYHIWAGKDLGANYQIYLKNPDKSAYISVQNTIVVDTGYIVKGSYESQTKDFTAPAGYKELCVRINGKDECGFKKVSTSFAVDYLTDKYYESQLEKNVVTKNACIGGSPSAYSLVQPNVQSGVQEMVDSSGITSGTGSLNRVGITRVCASENPGKSVDESRWKEVGYCDDESVKCWLDTISAKEVIQDKELENQITQTGDTASLLDKPIIDSQTAQTVFSEVRKRIIQMENQIENSNDKFGKIEELFDSIDSSDSTNELDLANLFEKLDEVELSEAGNSIKAEAVYLKFRIYYILGKWKSFAYYKKLENEIKEDISAIEEEIRTPIEEKFSWKIEERDGRKYLVRNPARDYSLFAISNYIYFEKGSYSQNIGEIDSGKMNFEKFNSDYLNKKLSGQPYYPDLEEDVEFFDGKLLSDFEEFVYREYEHVGIKATTFYVGSPGQEKSSWISDWVGSFGGVDNPDKRKLKNKICPDISELKMNPFYVALPAQPALMNNEEKKMNPKNYGKDSWVKIEYNKKIVYAQWEDVGPWCTKNYNYVFRDEFPFAQDNEGKYLADLKDNPSCVSTFDGKKVASNGAGIDFSPAVMYSLSGKTLNTLNSIAWEFVEEDQVSDGDWKNWNSICNS